MDNKDYRADVDGLRAVAVLAVIAAHLPQKFLPSGFLGVDVFFAISGFVVTASLLRQRRTGLPQLYAGFLARRIKRLMPALTACVAVAGFIVLATDPFPDASMKTGLAALFGFGNIVLFFFELDYFSPSSFFNAFTHTWSLGVEEQFYVVFPMFVWLFYYRPHSKTFRPLAKAMIVGGILSLSLFASLYESQQGLAFFMMPARIWELGVGALVFIGSRHLRSEKVQLALNRVSPFALAALVGCFLVPEHYAMPATVAAVGLTAILLAGNQHSPAARILTQRPALYVGRISYSLYLWHWPVIALGPIVLASAWRSSAVYVLIIALASVVSYHCIEKPLRNRNWSTQRIRDIGIGLGANVILAAVLGAAMIRLDAGEAEAGVTLYPAPYLPVMSNGRPHVLTCVLDGGSRQLQDDTVENCTVAPRTGSRMPTIWAMGDSHSGHLQAMLYKVHQSLGSGVHLVETPGWSFPFEPAREFAPRKALYERIRPLFRPGDIVLVSRKYITRTPPYAAEEIRPWLYNLARLAEDLALDGVKLVVTGPPPIFPFRDIRECSLTERETCRLATAAFAPLVQEVMSLLKQIESEHDNVAVFSIFDSVCPSDDDYCYPDDGTHFLYRDRDHFNSVGSQRLARPFVEMLRTSGMLAPEK